MKKILGITVLFMTLFMCMCCDPDPIEPVIPDTVETIADLDGVWEFVSLKNTSNNQFVTSCALYSKWKLNIEFDAATETCVVTDLCGDEGYVGPFIFHPATISWYIELDGYRGLYYDSYDAPYLTFILTFGSTGSEWEGELKLEKVE